MEHDVSFYFIRILSPAIKLLKIMPAIGRVTIEENAARRGIAESRRAGELLDLLVFVSIQLIYCDRLTVDQHFYAVGEALGDGIVREEQGQRDVISLSRFRQAVSRPRHHPRLRLPAGQKGRVFYAKLS